MQKGKFRFIEALKASRFDETSMGIGGSDGGKRQSNVYYRSSERNWV